MRVLAIRRVRSIPYAAATAVTSANPNRTQGQKGSAGSAEGTASSTDWETVGAVAGIVSLVGLGSIAGGALGWTIGAEGGAGAAAEGGRSSTGAFSGGGGAAAGLAATGTGCGRLAGVTGDSFNAGGGGAGSAAPGASGSGAVAVAGSIMAGCSAGTGFGLAVAASMSGGTTVLMTSIRSRLRDLGCSEDGVPAVLPLGLSDCWANAGSPETASNSPTMATVRPNLSPASDRALQNPALWPGLSRQEAIL